MYAAEHMATSMACAGSSTKVAFGCSMPGAGPAVLFSTAAADFGWAVNMHRNRLACQEGDEQENLLRAWLMLIANRVVACRTRSG